MSEPTDSFAVFRAWWADLPTRHSSATTRCYRYFVHRFLADVGMRPWEVRATDIRRHLDQMRTQHATNVRSALVDFFGFLVRRGVMDSSPLEEVRTPPGGRRRLKRGFEADEMPRLLIALQMLARDKEKGVVASWGALAAYSTGMRPGELVHLHARHVHLTEVPYLEITHTKTGNDRIVPLGPVAVEAFGELVARQPVGRLVPWGVSSWGEKIRQAALVCGIEPGRARAYSLRHGFANRLAEGGVHIRTIAQLLGHTDLRHTLVYTVPSDQMLRDAVGVI